MDDIASLLQHRHTPNPKALKHEWQAFAYKIWADYSGDPKELPQVMKFVKMHNDRNRAQLNDAYGFCKDYQGKIPKIKLFFWKFWQLKKPFKK